MDRRHLKAVIACLCLIITFSFGCISGVTLYEYTERTAQVEQEQEDFTPTPIVIETKSDEPFGTYEGTATIISPYNESECWAGLILIQRDGPEIRVTVMDAVESNYDELF